MCACAERRVAIVEGARAIAAGDRTGAAKQAAFIVSSSFADLRQIALSASHARLRSPRR